MNFIATLAARAGILNRNVDLHLLRASMVLIYLMFGYQKWFPYEAEVLIPYIANGPLIFWLHDLFGISGASIFLGVVEWTVCGLLIAGFWSPKAGVIGALISVATFIGTVTIIPFIPGAWEPSAGGFPAMVGPGSFLMKDFVLLAVSVYLLKEDLLRLGTRLDNHSPSEVFGPL